MIVEVSEVPDIAASVRAALAKAFAVDAEVLTAGASLYDDVGVDSLTLMELICALEEDLGIQVPETVEFALKIRTVGDLVEAFETRAPSAVKDR